MSKKLQEKQQRRLEAERKKLAQRKARQRGNLITIGVAVVIAALVTVAVVLQRGGGSGENVGVPRAQAGCTDIEEPEIEGNEHVPTGTDVQYQTTPPTSGSHWPPDAVAQADFYTTPVEEERLVHNMEHGQIILWYRPDAPQATLDMLEQIQQQERLATIVVPFPQVPEPYTYSVTAWGAMMSCENVSQEAIDQFRRRYQGRGPEPITPTFDG